MGTVKKASLLALPSIKKDLDSELNPKNMNGIWQDFSPTEVIAKPGIVLDDKKITELTEGMEPEEAKKAASILKRAKGLSSDDKVRIFGALAFELTLENPELKRENLENEYDNDPQKLLSAIVAGSRTLRDWRVTASGGYHRSDEALDRIKKRSKDDVEFDYEDIDNLFPKEDNPGRDNVKEDSAKIDNAMEASLKGGIDLTPSRMNLQAQSPGGSIQFHLDYAMLQKLQHAPGFVPRIINIKPMRNIRLFLGLTQTQTTIQ